MTAIELISLISSLISLILALVAIWYAAKSSKEVSENLHKTQTYMNDSYDKTKDLMNSIHERTKDVLSDIQKSSGYIERTVTESQKDLMNTLTNIVNETVIPKKPDIGEQLGMQFMQALLQDPKNAQEMMESLKPFMEIQKEKDDS